MLGMLKNLFSEKSAVGSKEIAKERLRLVLLHDRASVAPQYLGLLKDDMVKVVSNYMEINEQDMQVNLNREDQTMTLVANIPVSAVKRPSAVRNDGPQSTQAPLNIAVAEAEDEEDDYPGYGI